MESRKAGTRKRDWPLAPPPRRGSRPGRCPTKIRAAVASHRGNPTTVNEHAAGIVKQRMPGRAHPESGRLGTFAVLPGSYPGQLGKRPRDCIRALLFERSSPEHHGVHRYLIAAVTDHVRQLIDAGPGTRTERVQKHQ